ncbi:hypothetical protein ACFQYP_56840 [Nonomuraea antimicrobica]
MIDVARAADAPGLRWSRCADAVSVSVAASAGRRMSSRQLSVSPGQQVARSVSARFSSPRARASVSVRSWSPPISPARPSARMPSTL